MDYRIWRKWAGMWAFILLFLLVGRGIATEVSIIPHPQEMGIKGEESEFTIDGDTVIVIKDGAGDIDRRAYESLNAAIEERVFFTLKVVEASKFFRRSNAIVIGEPDAGNGLLDRLIDERGLGLLADYPGPEGYRLDVDRDFIIIAGQDPAGTFYGAASLIQMLKPVENNDALKVTGVTITDFPDMKYRSIFPVSVSNMQPELIENAHRIIKAAAALKYNMAAMDNHNYCMIEREAMGQPGKKIYECMQPLFAYARLWHINPRVEGGVIYANNARPWGLDWTMLEGIRVTQKITLSATEPKKFQIEVKGKWMDVANVMYDPKTGRFWEAEPVVVKSLDGKVTYREGRDYVVNFGEIKYPLFTKCHDGAGEPKGRTPRWAESKNPPTTIQRTSGSGIRDGETVKVTYTYIGPDRWRTGKIRYCFSDPRVYTDGPENPLWRFATQPVKYLDPKIVMVTASDEVRVYDFDKRCLEDDKKRTPSRRFAENMKYYYDTMKKVKPEVRMMIWSDMIDIYHNARHYGINDGAEEMIKLGMADVIVVPWSVRVAEKSIDFLMGKGFKEVMASVQTGPEALGAPRWATHLRKVYKNRPQHACGLQYTTWRQKILTDPPVGEAGESKKEVVPGVKLVADCAWSCAPYIIHMPVKKASLASREGIVIRAEFEGDRYIWNGEKTVPDPLPLKSAILYYRVKGKEAYKRLPMTADGNIYKAVIPSGAIARPGIEYYIEMADSQNTSLAPKSAPARPYFILAE